MLTLYKVFYAGDIFLYVVRAAILIYVVLSWFRPRFKLYAWLEAFVRPFVSPFRRLSLFLTARMRIPLDFSCWFALIGISLVDWLWWRLYYLLRMLS